MITYTYYFTVFFIYIQLIRLKFLQKKKKKYFGKVDNFLISAHCIFIHFITSCLIDGSIIGINLFVVKNNAINHSKTLRLKVTYQKMFILVLITLLNSAN